jgi:hypothetical protein
VIPKTPRTMYQSWIPLLHFSAFYIHEIVQIRSLNLMHIPLNKKFRFKNWHILDERHSINPFLFPLNIQ